MAPTKASGGIMKFAVKGKKCLNCKITMSKSAKGTLCSHCIHLEPQIYVETAHRVNKLEESFNRLWTQCQRCQGSLHQDVLCTSRDCPIFYQRKKVQLDLDSMTKKLEDFTF